MRFNELKLCTIFFFVYNDSVFSRNNQPILILTYKYESRPHNNNMVDDYNNNIILYSRGKPAAHLTLLNRTPAK